MTARIVVVDDHPLMRRSLVKLVREETDHEVVGEAGTVTDARMLVQRLSPDLVLLDLTLADGSGFELVREWSRPGGRPRVALLTMHSDDQHVREAADLEVDAYISKGAAPHEIVEAIDSVLAGGSYISPEIATRLFALQRRGVDDGGLSPREGEILRELAHGARVDDVARRLVISPKTVKNHLTSIYAKLGVETGSQAVAEAYRRGLVDPDW